MAINPFQIPVAGKRFFANDAITLLRLEDPKALLLQSASRIVRECPPSFPWAAPYRGEVCRGLFMGPTSIAYFFWTLSTRHPDLEIEGKNPADWCRVYLYLGQETVPPLLNTGCGISNEYLASNALKACLGKSESHAIKVLDALRSLETDLTYCEWLRGRAGALYILRIMRKGIPELVAAINAVIILLIEDMLPQQPWIWNNCRYLGSGHGEIGILTQIVLSDPSYAPKLESKLTELLKLQDAEGNWPVIEGKDIGLVQFCHGAPGFVPSLLAIRQYFSTLHKQIDKAVTLGRKLIWEKGLLTKAPNLCHGIIGNALSLEGKQREHFLCFASPEKIEQGVVDGIWEKDQELFGILWGEAGRAWVWMEAWDGSQGKFVLYSDC
ncbi:hypothetical protein G7Y89_g12513 [Cudoniella acicularis]|uniref:Uncharacterized protein n=1 Tax=Cudoniella acicularis TaxID=354080 RepID=A0A8H4RB29_9HELO|nr:hypothetical protein G7Y89_g12513 [Cudoniella acicularis]